jgi:nucleotide-binding universal stress UspA family protein
MAHWYQARLTLLYVFASLPTMEFPPLTLEAADRERLMKEMRQMAAGVPAGVTVDVRVQDADYVHDEILAQLTATRADLLVLGTHGRSGFQRLFLGSVTEKVMRKATCPTLVVPPRAPDVAPAQPVEFKRILCPVDFSESSLEALAYAINIAEESDARLTLLHVVEIPLGSDYEGGPEALKAVRAAAAADSRQRLHDLVPDQARTYCTIDIQIVEGRAYREVIRQAGDLGADLIVMGVHGRSAMDLVLFGSTTHHVVRAAVCPVLIVRPR